MAQRRMKKLKVLSLLLPVDRNKAVQTRPKSVLLVQRRHKIHGGSLITCTEEQHGVTFTKPGPREEEKEVGVDRYVLRRLLPLRAREENRNCPPPPALEEKGDVSILETQSTDRGAAGYGDQRDEGLRRADDDDRNHWWRCRRRQWCAKGLGEGERE